MSEYHAFADLAEEYDGVHLDTTMAATDFTERFAPLTADCPPRLAGLRDKVVHGSDFPNIPYPYASVRGPGLAGPRRRLDASGAVCGITG